MCKLYQKFVDSNLGRFCSASCFCLILINFGLEIMTITFNIIVHMQLQRLSRLSRHGCYFAFKLLSQCGSSLRFACIAIRSGLLNSLFNCSNCLCCRLFRLCSNQCRNRLYYSLSTLGLRSHCCGFQTCLVDLIGNAPYPQNCCGGGLFCYACTTRSN